MYGEQVYKSVTVLFPLRGEKAFVNTKCHDNYVYDEVHSTTRKFNILYSILYINIHNIKSERASGRLDSGQPGLV